MTYNTISYQDVYMNIFCNISFPYQDVYMMNIVFCSISFRINVLSKNNNLMSWCILLQVNLAKHYSKILLWKITSFLISNYKVSIITLCQSTSKILMFLFSESIYKVRWNQYTTWAMSKLKQRKFKKLFLKSQGQPYCKWLKQSWK